MTHHRDVFAKADALMKKHHSAAIPLLPPDAIPAAPAPQPAEAKRPEADIPVLTDIVAEALPEPVPIPVLTEAVEDGWTEESVSDVSEPQPALEALPHPEQPGQQEETPSSSQTALPEPANEPSVPETGQLAEQILRELEDRIREGLAHQLAPQLAAALEKSLAGALDQFTMQIEYLVRDAVSGEVRRQLDALQSDCAASSAKKTAD